MRRLYYKRLVRAQARRRTRGQAAGSDGQRKCGGCPLLRRLTKLVSPRRCRHARPPGARHSQVEACAYYQPLDARSRGRAAPGPAGEVRRAALACCCRPAGRSWRPQHRSCTPYLPPPSPKLPGSQPAAAAAAAVLCCAMSYRAIPPGSVTSRPEDSRFEYVMQGGRAGKLAELGQPPQNGFMLQKNLIVVSGPRPNWPLLGRLNSPPPAAWAAL